MHRSPITQNAGEIRGTVARAEYMLSIAAKALADVDLKDTDTPGFRRFIRRDPLGVVFTIAPWKYVKTLPCMKSPLISALLPPKVIRS